MKRRTRAETARGLRTVATLVALLITSGVAPSCRNASTTIIVRITAAPRLAPLLSTVTVVATEAGGPPVTQEYSGEQVRRLPGEIIVHPHDPAAGTTLTVVVTGHISGTNQQVTTTGSAPFWPGHPVLLPVHLSRGCADTTCQQGYRCREPALCVPRAKLDLLFVVDNSDSMQAAQARLTVQVPQLIAALSQPQDRNLDGIEDFIAVEDIHVGVLSTDMGTLGQPVPGCEASAVGDNGNLNPIRFGSALRLHPPGTAPNLAPHRPVGCTELPAFLRVSPTRDDAGGIARDVACAATLGGYGCGIEQPLDAVYSALVLRRGRAPYDTTLGDDAFLRDDAYLAIVVLTDDDDGSTYEPDVFNAASPRWRTPDLNARFYQYAPGSMQDPTLPLDHYVDPHNAAIGLLGLKPGHPERVLFLAITGVPLEVPTVFSDGAVRTNWDDLLGLPNSSNHDAYNERNDSLAYHRPDDPGGPVTMHQGLADATCPDGVMPACWRQGNVAPATVPCTPAAPVEHALPARRLVEIARRFDESPLCDARPCRNGWVSSICRNDYGPAIDALVARLHTLLRDEP